MTASAEKRKYRFGERLNPIAAVLLSVSVFVGACSAAKPTLRGDSGARWSSLDPLGISYAVRLAQFEKGNLVGNFSLMRTKK